MCSMTVPQENTTSVHKTSGMPRTQKHTTEYGQPPRPSTPTSSYAKLPHAVRPSSNPAQNVQPYLTFQDELLLSRLWISW